VGKNFVGDVFNLAEFLLSTTVLVVAPDSRSNNLSSFASQPVSASNIAIAVTRRGRVPKDRWGGIFMGGNLIWIITGLTRAIFLAFLFKIQQKGTYHGCFQDFQKEWWSVPNVVPEGESGAHGLTAKRQH